MYVICSVICVRVHGSVICDFSFSAGDEFSESKIVEIWNSNVRRLLLIYEGYPESNRRFEIRNLQNENTKLYYIHLKGTLLSYFST